METLLLPFSPRFIILTICAVVTALLLSIGIFDHNPKAFDVIIVPLIIFGGLTTDRNAFADLSSFHHLYTTPILDRTGFAQAHRNL